ncbi:MAG: tetratricopeptide repeat protein [Saprospiraceae bacterium]|nr:tetratricopeptide repeat protein [Saprospiraceae bacterium]
MHYLKKRAIYLLATAMVMVGATSCVTTKKKGDTSKLGKLWHNMNSRYNAHFNAEVLLDETLLAVDNGHQDIYSEPLPVYKYIEVDDPQQFAEDMDKAIEKTAIAISIHRPSHWTDDNYLLMAKAQFIKQDYESAEATLRYLIKHYDPENLVKASSSRTNARSAEERKLLAKERAKENKVAQKEREQKIKERRKSVNKSRKKSSKKSKKARDKERQARIKERRQQIKDNQKPNSKKSEEDAPAEPVSTDKKGKKAKQEPFSENPDLPKVKGSPENYFLKHKPIHQEAQLWLAKTLIERDRFGEAATILRNLERDPNTFEEVREEAFVVRAYSAMKRGLEGDAVTPLANALEIVKDRKRKARLAFILAQVQEANRSYAAAGASYDEVVRLKPGYEMTFNADLNKSIMLWNAGQMPGADFDKRLKKMIRDDKNTEYLDQLYYALGNKEYKAGNIPAAIFNYSSSVQKSAGNKVQLTESYHTMATIYFEEEDYIKAKYYFDSTLTVMPKHDERIADVRMFAKNLSQIAANLEEIVLQDSLLALAELPENELRKMASRIKKEQKKAEAIKLANSTTNQPGRATLSQTSQLAGAGGQQSSFFAYNEKLLKKGQRDFDREWRGVPLEDDWRRSNKSSFASTDSGDGEEGEEEQSLSKTEVEEIFSDVPKTDAEKLAANKKIEDALYKLGQLFRSELENNPKSVESLEQLLNRYPATEHELNAFYLLFVAYNEMGNTAKANTYRDLILNKHPTSDYASYIKNPSLLQNLESEEDKIASFYKEVYAMYEAGRVKQAFNQLDESKKSFGTKHKLQSKFAFLSALCVGRLKGREPYINALKELIAKYPKTEEEKEAKEIIRLLGVRLADLGGDVQEINPDAYFALEPNDKLHFALVPMRSNKNLNQGRVSIAEYNTKFHKLDRLTIGTIVLDDGVKKVPTYVVRRFDSREKAMAYYEGVMKNIEDFIPNQETYEVYVASQRNYRKIVQLKSMDLYREFFVREYLSK